MHVYTLLPYLKRTQGRVICWRALIRDDIPPIDASRISVTYVLYLRRGARSLCWPYISDERTEYRAPARLSYPSSPRASIPWVFVLLFLSRLSVPLVSGRRGGTGGGRASGGSLEVSLTILRNFADSLARVDHVRPGLRSHESGREGVNGFSRGSEGSEGGKDASKRDGTETPAETRARLASAKGSFTTVSQDMHT